MTKREEIFKKYSSSIRNMARHYARMQTYSGEDDLLSVGSLGLSKALDTYDPSYGSSVETYAKIHIRWAMLDEIRSSAWVPRSVQLKINVLSQASKGLSQKLIRQPTNTELADELSISEEQLDKLLGETQGASSFVKPIDEDTRYEPVTGPDTSFRYTYFRELQKILQGVIGTLTKRQRQLVTLYYFEERTMKEVAKAMGLTESSCSKIHKNHILPKLKRRLASRGITSFDE